MIALIVFGVCLGLTRDLFVAVILTAILNGLWKTVQWFLKESWRARRAQQRDERPPRSEHAPRRPQPAPKVRFGTPSNPRINWGTAPQRASTPLGHTPRAFRPSIEPPPQPPVRYVANPPDPLGDADNQDYDLERLIGNVLNSLH